MWQQRHEGPRKAAAVVSRRRRPHCPGNVRVGKEPARILPTDLWFGAPRLSIDLAQILIRGPREVG